MRIIGIHPHAQVDLAQIVDAHRPLRPGLGPAQRRQQQRREHRNNGQHHQHFHQSEPGRAMGVGLVFHPRLDKARPEASRQGSLKHSPSTKRQRRVPYQPGASAPGNRVEKARSIILAILSVHSVHSVKNVRE